MARKARKYAKSGLYHVIVRGIDKQNIFLEDNDKRFFIARIKKYAEELNIKVYSYCLMDNHVHILLSDPEKKVSLFMKKLEVSYVYYFNHKYERSGPLFQDRFKSECIENEIYLKTVLRYIVRNPEKANICRFDEYKWSYISHERYVLDLFGGTIALKKFLRQKNLDICMEYENKKVINDSECLDLLRKYLGIKNPRKFFRFYEKNKSKYLLIQMKNMGFPVKQIARITGINQKTISNA